MATLSIRQLKFGILELLAKVRHQHKINIIGRVDGAGHLETHLGMEFDNDTRYLADRAFEQLKEAGLIRPTYRDLASPGDWVEITAKGKKALELRALDDLDGELTKLDPHLVEIRDGAWIAALGIAPDSLRQAAHSGRELIEQVLRIAAPEEEIKQATWFKPDPSSRSGITRRHRLKLIMQKRKGHVSEDDLKIIEKACDLVIAIDEKLQAIAHASSEPLQQEVLNALSTAEMVLTKILA